MAIHNPSNLYSAGAVTLNSQPSVNLYAQLISRKQAQEQAKQEAFDEYLRGLNTKLTPTGVRSQDMEAFNYKKNKWMEYGLQNKEKLRRGDIPTQVEFNRLYQDALNIPIWSKQAEEDKKPIAEILTNPDKRERLSSNVIPAIASHDEPLWVKDEKTGDYVWNENRKPLDYKSNLFDPKFDFTKAFGEWSKGMVMDEKVGKMISKDPVTGTVKFETTKEFTPEQITQNAENAARSVMDNPEYHNYYQYRWEKIDENELKKATEAFQSVYGKDITLPSGKKIPNIVDSPEKLAAAEAISQSKSMSQKGTKDILDRQLANQRAQININLNRGGGGGNEIHGNEFDRIDYDAGGVNIKGGIATETATGNKYNGNIRVQSKLIPAQVQAILKSAGIDISGERYFKLNYKDGQLESITPERSGKMIDRLDMENAQRKWNTEGQKQQQPGFGERDVPKQPTQGKTMSAAEFRKLSITQRQQFLNSGGKVQ